MKDENRKMQINQAENKILSALYKANRHAKQKKSIQCAKSGGIVAFYGVFGG